MFGIGAPVLDRRANAPARVTSVLDVPESLDLFGLPVKPHQRFTLAYDDGRWANDRTEADLEHLVTA